MSAGGERVAVLEKRRSCEEVQRELNIRPEKERATGKQKFWEARGNDVCTSILSYWL